jgi:HEPN domain-containing protein
VDLPVTVKQGEKLTRFAVFTRYPGIASPVSHEEYEEALNLAEEILNWVKKQIKS